MASELGCKTVVQRYGTEAELFRSVSAVRSSTPEFYSKMREELEARRKES